MERLIRNWVIRPADLIFDQGTGQWNPIGEHPDFIGLFQSLDEADQGLEATVITPQAADSAPLDRDETGDEQQLRSTQPGAAILRRPRRSQRSDSPPEEQNSRPEPPVPSPEVEGVAHDPDEITVMTDRTLDLLTVDSESPASPLQEKTELIERPIFDDEDELPRGRHGLPEDVFATAELPGPVDRDEVLLDELAELGDADSELSAETVLTPHPDGPARWNILIDEGPPPEEIARPEDEPEQEPDELDQTAEFIASEDDEEAIGLAVTLEMDEFSSEVGEESEEELEPEEEAEAEEEAEEAEEPASEEELEPEKEEEEEEEPESAAIPLEELMPEEPDSEELELDSQALEEALTFLEIVATAAQDEDSADFFVPVEPLHQPRVDMTAEAYEMELPFEVTPSEEARQLGITPTTLSEDQRDAFFSRPYPKESGTFITVTYDLSGLSDSEEQPRSFVPKIAIAIAVGALILLLLLLAIL